MSGDEDIPGYPRPRENPDLVGQEEAEAAFHAAFAAGRPAHAWLLSGPRGIGKATLAYRLARHVFAGGAPAAHDPDSPLFRRVASGGHADLLVVERTVNPKTEKLRTEIVVEDARQIKDFLRKTPAEGGWRVVVVDGVEEMNEESVNSLLKPIEEPFKRSLLLLVSHNSGRLLPTIRSRCRRLVLKPLGEAALATLLDRYRPDLAPEDRALLGRVSEGSIGRALSLSDADGLALYHQTVAMLDGLPGLDVPGVHKLGEGAARDTTGAAFAAIGELVRWWLAREMHRRVGGAGLDRWFEVWEKVGRLFDRADAVNLDRKQVILNAFSAIDAAAGR